MGERILERMRRLAEEYQREQSAQIITTSSRPAESATQSSHASNEAKADQTKDELRRARTHRLVQIGALTDQYLGTSELTPEEVGQVLISIMEFQEPKGIIRKVVG